MTLFETACQFVLSTEGGWSNDPNDDGGLTRFGISSLSHPDVDLENLTVEQATEIYRERYWEVARCDKFPPKLAVALFDGAVQHSPKQAIRFMQRALMVAVDGVVGPQTLTAAKALNEGAILARFLSYRMLLYAAHSDWGHYGLGWTRRLFGLQRYIYEEGL